MADSIEQQVIDFTVNYTGYPPESINDTTSLDSIGIEGEQDRMQYIMELEDNFTLTYEDGDANGIVTVGNATMLIKKKMGG